MLRIIQNRSAASAKSYYSRADYYGEGQDRPGRWGGRAAKMLGLEGRIHERDFQALCDNRDPRTGARLTARQNTDRTVGYDFNWHVPKNVSLAYALGGDERIEEVFERSVSETMQEMEQEAMTRVRVGGKQENRITGNLAWGQFVHTTTRPDDNGEVDPHLHAHCFVFNVTYDGKEERFKAAQFRELKRDASYFEARMHARLAKYLREELGYSIQRDGRRWDIAGIPTATREKFSRRTQEIEQAAKEQGITSADEKAELGAKTRNSKSGHESFAELQTGWRSRLEHTETRLFESLGRSSAPGAVNGPESAQDAVRNAIMHSFERDSVVPERQVLAEAMRMGVGTVDVNEVAGEAQRQGLLSRKVHGRQLATTAEVLKDEVSVLSFARDTRGAVTPLNASWRPKDDWLSEEQLDAIEQLTGSRDRVQLILGGAGTGKTTLMQQAVSAINEGGHEVFTFAPSAEASRKVLRDEGFENATTVAELLINEKLQAKTANQVIWIDEASLLGSRQLKQVVDLAASNGARLILSGDWKRQHGSVERGGVLGLLDRYAGTSPIQINTIRRQSGRYREAISAMSQGDVSGGFDMLDGLGCVHELDDEVRDTQIAADYADIAATGKSVLVVSPTHREADRLTASIRDTLRARGRLADAQYAVTTLKPLHLTEGERRDAAFLNQGDVIVFHQNAKGFRKGTRLIVNGTLPETITSQADRFSVYRPSSIELSAGDKIRITSGGKTRDGQHRLNNGAVFDVAEINRQGDIRLANGWTIDAGFGHLTYGYVSTSHSSQGRTVNHVLIAESADSLPAASREQLYVSASRGKKSVRIYTDNKTDLREAILESSTQAAASEVFLSDGAVERHEKQQRVATRERQRQAEIFREVTYER